MTVSMPVTINGAVGSEAELARSAGDLQRGLQAEINRWVTRELRPGGILSRR